MDLQIVGVGSWCIIRLHLHLAADWTLAPLISIQIQIRKISTTKKTNKERRRCVTDTVLLLTYHAGYHVAYGLDCGSESLYRRQLVNALNRIGVSWLLLIAIAQSLFDTHS